MPWLVQSGPTDFLLHRCFYFWPPSFYAALSHLTCIGADSFHLYCGKHENRRSSNSSGLSKRRRREVEVELERREAGARVGQKGRRTGERRDRRSRKCLKAGNGAKKCLGRQSPHTIISNVTHWPPHARSETFIAPCLSADGSACELFTSGNAGTI